MPDWKRIIVGDAFKLPSRNPRYYLDLMLIVPLFFAGVFLFESVHTWHVNQWDLKQAGISGGLVCLFTLLIKDHVRVVAEIIYTFAFLTWLHFSVHGDLESLKFSLLFALGLVLTLVLGTAFRIFVLKTPIDPSYYNRDRRTTPLGIVLVLGLLFGLGFVGIYLAYR
jgi:hypothetical protein